MYKYMEWCFNCNKIKALKECDMCNIDECEACIFDNICYTNMFKLFCENKCMSVPPLKLGKKNYSLWSSCINDYRNFIVNFI